MAKFNVEKARAAGVSEEQIAKFLASRPDVKPSEPLRQVTKGPQKKTFMENVAENVQYQQDLGPNAFSPARLLERGYEMANKGAAKMGEFAAEQLGERGVNPYVAAGAGKVLAAAPNIISAFATPVSAVKSNIPNMAIAAKRRELGITFPDVKTKFGRGKASQAALVALQNNVGSPTANPAETMQRAEDLASKSGQVIGDIRESMGPQPVQKFIDALDDYKSARLKGRTGGEWQPIADKIDKAKETIIGLVREKIVKAVPASEKATGLVDAAGKEIKKAVPAVKGYMPPVGLKDVAEAKKEITSIVNWFNQNVSQAEAKKIGGVLEKAMESIIGNVGGATKSVVYKAAKNIYGAAETMKRGLTREIGKQQGHNLISLPSLVAGATGGPAAALKIGAYELAKRRGAGIASNVIMNVANSPRYVPATTGTIYSMATDALAKYRKKKK